MADCKIINADVLAGLAQLPDASVQCCVTSPPYWGLRDYGVAGHLRTHPPVRRRGDAEGEEQEGVGRNGSELRCQRRPPKREEATRRSERASARRPDR